MSVQIVLLLFLLLCLFQKESKSRQGCQFIRSLAGLVGSYLIGICPGCVTCSPWPLRTLRRGGSVPRTLFPSAWGWVRFPPGDAWNLPSEGIGVGVFPLISPAEGAGALAPAQFNSLHARCCAWTDMRGIHTVSAATTTTTTSCLHSRLPFFFVETQ